ncbi:MAG: transketolase [Finegoldia sp.]|nr:transketolase [Finegoldia sp.]
MDKKQLAINTVRNLSVDMIQKANSGHPGLPLGASPMAFVLFNDFLKHSPNHPDWINRDRFVLSAGHGSAMLYSLLHIFGYDISKEDLENFRQLNSKTAGHPEYLNAQGIDATTGPLGQGISMAVGMAIAQEILAAKFNKDDYKIFDNYTYVLVGDGCLQEGISNEASSLAGSLKLSKLICLYDSNNITIEGDTENVFSENVRGRYEALGWDTYFVENGNDIEKIAKAIEEAKASDKPSLIEVKTKIGFGSVFEGSEKCHGAPLGKENIPALRKNLAWEYDEDFYVPKEVRDLTRESVEKNDNLYAQWEDTLNKYKNAYPQDYDLLEKFFKGDLDEEYLQSEDFMTFEKDDASRGYSSTILNRLKDKIPNLVGGSADLSSSNKTFLKGEDIFSKDNRNARNLQFGVREHAMGAISNGISLYGGLRPYCATFFVFSDYLKPALRLSALMKQGIIYIFTHDSIGVGEDGPTHEPIEHLAMLRAIPNLLTIRPCDGLETACAYRVALENKDRPSALVLSRQTLPNLEESSDKAMKGAYVIKDFAQSPQDLQGLVIATGSEVKACLDACQILSDKGIKLRLISMPCQEVFDQQDDSYKEEVLPGSITKRVSVECASTYGWQKYTGLSGLNIGIDSFGMSAPGKVLMDYFGFTSEKIAQNIEDYLNK